MDHSKKAIELFDKIAGIYQDTFMDLDLYDDTYNTFCNLIAKTHSSVFEIACGPGNITKYLLSKRPDLEILAIDMAPTMIRLAQDNNPTAQFKIMDCRDIDALDTQFDAIICGFCMPYLSKEESLKLIKDCAHLLNPGGIFYFSTIEGNYEKSGYETGSNGDSVYVYYHQEDYLVEGLRENYFEVVETQRKPYQNSDGTPSTHLIIIARKN
jgi:2-polyprenyl-3-methyl-5-hydroxy-6-metoxy-1,4-benzoquinol methylase